MWRCRLRAEPGNSSEEANTVRKEKGDLKSNKPNTLEAKLQKAQGKRKEQRHMMNQSTNQPKKQPK